jgi:hypothetical protein
MSPLKAGKSEFTLAGFRYNGSGWQETVLLFHGFHPRFTLLIQCRLDLLLSLKPVIPI